MDLFRWIKREWDTTQNCKRRDSAPPITASAAGAYNLHQSPKLRDEAYLRALRKFNEWRRKERLTSTSICRISRKSSLKSDTSSYLTRPRPTAIESTMLADTRTKQHQNDDEENNDEAHLYEELLTPQSLKKHLPGNIKNHRQQKTQSFPLIAHNNTNKNINLHNAINALKSPEKCPAISEVNEIEEFENQHCKINGTFEEQPKQLLSPPKKFFRDNSNPFQEVRSPPARLNRYALRNSYGTPRRLFDSSSMHQTDVVPPFIRDSLPKDSDTISGNYTAPHSGDSNKRYDFNPSAIYENCELQSAQTTKAMSEYQTIVNRHGDLVDYAIPFNDQNVEIFSESRNYRNSCDSNLKAASKLKASTVPCIVGDTSIVETMERKQRTSISLCDLKKYAEVEKVRKSMMITDLDKSDDGVKMKTTSAEEVFEELSALENWSKRVFNHMSIRRSRELQSNNLILCTADDISQRSSEFRSTIQTPIQLSSGNFRRTSVCLRRIEKRFRPQSEQGLLHDLSILNKIKHPNVALLMAVCLDSNEKILSIVMEPFVTNINCLIYDSDYKIPINDCVDYVLQVAKATIYLHENGLIHSNICSHNVLVCDGRKTIKLSSFELTTEVDSDKIRNEIVQTFYGSLDSFQRNIIKRSIQDEGWNSLMCKIPGKFVPYLVEYRKLYSEHFYQPPELLTTTNHFVFPTRQSDVYSITLLLWEMLNSCVPFAIFTYEEIENLFRLNENNQLPLFDSDRCEYFRNLLENGLSASTNRRIENIQSIKYLIDEAKLKFSAQELAVKSSIKSLRCKSPHSNREKLEEISLGGLSTENSQGPCSSIETTENLNGRKLEDLSKCQEPVRSTTPLTPNRYASRSLDDILQADSLEEKKKDYKFQIDAFSLPSTPIARKNKLRRNAWLSNRALHHESFNEIEEDVLEQLNNQNETVESATNKNKLLNVSIKIIQNKIDKDDGSTTSKPQTPDSSSKVSAQIDYWNNIISPGEINLKKQNNTELNASNLSGTAQSEPDGPTQQSTPIVPTENEDRSDMEKLVKDRAKYYPNMPELLSETFLRRSFRDTNDFENTLWKREKQLCEKSSPRLNATASDSAKSRASVKETVHKFESISKSDRAIRCVPQRSQSERLNTNKICNREKVYSKSITDDVKSNLKADNPVINLTDQNVSFLEMDSTTPDQSRSSTEKCDSNTLETTVSPQPTDDTTALCDPVKVKTSYLSIYSLSPRNENAELKSPRSTTFVRKTKPTLFSVNIRKLNRRASDIGCIRKPIKRENSLRHSICGTDIVRSVARMNLKNKLLNSNGSSPRPIKSVASLTENDIQYCKLSCWKCGSKVFKMDEIAFNERAARNRRFLRRFANSSMTSTDGSQRLYPGSSVEEIKSTEDLYIDDDFDGGHETLGANMRLLSPQQDDDLFDILSIDFLSTEISEPVE